MHANIGKRATWFSKYFIKQVETNQSFRSNLSQTFFKIGVLKTFAMFTGKHVCWNLFLIKCYCLNDYNFIKKKLQHRCFPVNIAKLFRAAFFYRAPPVPASSSCWKFTEAVSTKIFLLPKCNDFQIFECFFNTLQPGVAYLHPLERSENLKVFWCFQGV